jgi:hypothetical protein
LLGWGVGYFQPEPADGAIVAKGYVANTLFGGWHPRRKEGKPHLSVDRSTWGERIGISPSETPLHKVNISIP